MGVRVHIARHRDVLARLNLLDAAGVRAWAGSPIKLQRGRRDVCRIETTGENGQPLVLFLKRNYRPYRKHAIGALVSHGRMLASAEVEADNLARLRRMGVPASPCVAVGAEFGPLGERFSYIITESVPGVPLDEWLESNPGPGEVERAAEILAQMLRTIHDTGIGLPTLLARHLFIDPADVGALPALIDVDRLALPRSMARQRIRDLAQLHFSIPLAHLGLWPRLAMLRRYAGGDVVAARKLLRRIARRTHSLVLRRQRRAAEFLAGLAPQIAQRIRLAAARAGHARRLLAWGTHAAVACTGLGLIWSAYVLAYRDLLPLDESEEWAGLADHIDNVVGPHLALSDWLLSPTGLLGLGLVLGSLIVGRRVLIQRR